MSGVTIDYKGSTIATIEDTGSKVLKTQGKYCEGDILVEYEAPPAPQPTLITKQITANGTYAAEHDNADGYSEVEVDVDINQNLDAYIQGDLKDIVTKATVIGSYVFSRSRITSISMPYVTRIEDTAFDACTLLANITFPNTLTHIGSYAFNGCSSLTNLIFPEGLQTIGSRAFQNCSRVVSVDMTALLQIPTISASTFNLTTCIFLFRDQTQLDAYATATNWSALADRFQIKP